MIVFFVKNCHLTVSAISGANLSPFSNSLLVCFESEVYRRTHVFCVSSCVFISVMCVCTPCKKEARERERETVGEMTGFGCDLFSYALVIM